jgi:AcrR family transcriptional regulator
MFIQMKKRKYQQKRRAEQAQQTRQSIVEAAMQLHEELGPAKTSIKAIAEQAGVQRLTVYRHFADEAALFNACTSHWLGLHPPPQPEDWQHHDDPCERTAAALSAFYRYYRNTENMWRVSYRDVEEVEALQAPMTAIEIYLDDVSDELVASWQLKGKDRQRLSLTLRHCLSFTTWYSFKTRNLSDKKIVDLVLSWISKQEK